MLSYLKHSLSASRLLLMSMLSFLCWAVVELVEEPRSRSSKSAPARSTNCKAPPTPREYQITSVPHHCIHLAFHGPVPVCDKPGQPVRRSDPRSESARLSFAPTPPSPGTRMDCLLLDIRSWALIRVISLAFFCIYGLLFNHRQALTFSSSVNI